MGTKAFKMFIEGRQNWINPRSCSRLTAVIIARFFFLSSFSFYNFVYSIVAVTLYEILFVPYL